MDVDKVRRSPITPPTDTAETDLHATLEAAAGRRRRPGAEPALGTAPPRKLPRADTAASWPQKPPTDTERDEAADRVDVDLAVDARLSAVDFNLLFLDFRSDTLALDDGEGFARFGRGRQTTTDAPDASTARPEPHGGATPSNHAALPADTGTPARREGSAQANPPHAPLSLRQVSAMARERGDRKEQQVLKALCDAAGVSESEPFAQLARQDGDVEALRAFREAVSPQQATGARGLVASPPTSASSDDSRTSHDSNKAALEEFQSQLSVLQEPEGLNLTEHRVVAISRDPDVRLALENVRSLLSVLADPHGVHLSPRQVVAIAMDENVRSAQRAAQVLMNMLRK